MEYNGSSTVRLFQFTDTHIFAEPDQTFDGVDTTETLENVIHYAKSANQAPDLAIFTGDLVHEPDEISYLRFRALISEISVPIYCLPGNHDDPELMQALLNVNNITTQKSIRTPHWHIILLDTFKQNSHSGVLSETELEWLKIELEQARDNHVLLFLHHHPVSIASPWMDTMILENGDALFEVIHGSTVRVMIWGHIHQEYEGVQDGIKLIGSPSTCIQFTPKSTEFRQDDLPPAYREISLSADGDIETVIHYLPENENQNNL